MEEYVDVILPVPLPKAFTYALSEADRGKVSAGYRVVVSFGRKKFYTGIVCKVHHTPPGGYEVKEVSVVLDEAPVVLPGQLAFWAWIADYYLCTLGDVYKAAIPSGLKLESETIVTCNPDFVSEEKLSEREQKVLDVLSDKKELSLTKLEKESGVKNVLVVVRALLDKEALSVKEELRDTYKPKQETRAALNEEYVSEEQLKQLFETLGRAPKQLALLMKYIELSGCIKGQLPREVGKKELLSKASVTDAVFAGLVAKGIFRVYKSEVGRLQRASAVTAMLHPLNSFQEKAYAEIVDCFRQKDVCLLHGVTSSGKTEIYIHLIEETIRQGKQVLYMLPEIALTTQITERLRRVFGNKLGIYHSKFSDAERVEIWQRQLGAESYDLILGARSSVFLPFKNLGLVIIDEEHENSYKQQDPAPRYHARSAAIVLAAGCKAKTLLGTATPAVETYYNALKGKYGLVELNERYKEMQLPEVIPVDIKELKRKKRMKGQFSPFLLECINEALGRKEQVILFQNRRGFAPMVECRMCGWVPKCKNCDVSLTYHKGMNQLTCHYCGYTCEVPRSCPACEGTELLSRGFGTEKVEDDIKLLFPQARVARMDLDTTRSRTSYEKIIADFEQGKTDILIGTQMISKGLDFDRVNVVGILDADSMLNYPDFRSYERAFQLMAQVAGRAGRKGRRGKVVLQSRNIDNPVIGQVMTNNYRQMVDRELAERKLFRYPPYYHIIYIYLKNRNEVLLDEMAKTVASRLLAVFGNRILGPDKPPVARVQTLFIRKIIVKIESNASMSRARQLLSQLKEEALQDENLKSLIIYYDVDPQ